MRTLEKRQGQQTGCLDDIAFYQGWSSREMLEERAEMFRKSDCGRDFKGPMG